jgi:DUF1680 family protein
LASLPSYFYSTSSEGLWIHLFDNNELNWVLNDGSNVSVTQKTDYPWSGKITVRVSSDSRNTFSLFVRIPGWVSRASVTLNDSPITHIKPGTYLQIERIWKDEILDISINIGTELVESNRCVSNNRGSVAVKRGPIVYCLEGVDHNGQNVRDLSLKGEGVLLTRHEPDLLDGVTTVLANGQKYKDCGNMLLYRPVSEATEGEFSELQLKFVPYYAWANRGATSMAVWVPLIVKTNPRF